MPKESLAQQMSTPRLVDEDRIKQAGPFVAISREFGCGGFSLGLLLLDLLTDNAEEGKNWQIYHKEILENLATDTGLAMDIIERQRREKPRLLSNFFSSVAGKKGKMPSGMEIRNRMTTIIRELAMEGHAILIGQGAAGATNDLPNGISVRLVAPEAWRIKQVAFREGLGEIQAKIRVNEETERRLYLQKIYERKFSSKPAFSLTFDCSVFSLAQIATLTHRAMHLMKCV
ncbi:MAG: cytidylate kinase family protein [Phycisphaerae bacterium]|nr:cytidylate kinase family protein [Phycisphaerae bacterium]